MYLTSKKNKLAAETITHGDIQQFYNKLYTNNFGLLCIFIVELVNTIHHWRIP